MIKNITRDGLDVDENSSPAEVQAYLALPYLYRCGLGHSARYGTLHLRKCPVCVQDGQWKKWGHYERAAR